MSGYVMVPGWLLDLDPSGTDLLVYCRLAGFGTFNTAEGSYEECRPPLPKLAERCKVSVSTVQRSLRWLREHGAIVGTERAKPDGSPLPTLYRVIFGNLAGPGVVASVTPPGSTGDTGGGRTGETRVVSPVTTEEEPSTQNPSTQSSGKAKPSRARKGEEASDPKLQPTLQGWIDYAGSKGVKLTKRQISIYGREIKLLLAQGFDEKLIKTALGRMLQRNQQGRPTLLDSFVAEIQGRPHVFPTSGAPAGAAARPMFPSAAERRAQAKMREQAIYGYMDEVIAEMKEAGAAYDPLDPEEQHRVQAEAERRYEMSLQVETQSTGCQPVPYTGNRQTDAIDVEWTEGPTPKELTSHASA